MKRVLVTGAAGFLGRQVLAPLLESGFEVHAADIRQITVPSVNFHLIDLMDPDRVRSMVREICPTHLLHLAWYVKHGEFWTGLENVAWLQASISLLLAFADAGGKRVVSAGTCAEYEWGHDLYIEEETPCRPSTLYGSCKVALASVQTALCRQLQISSSWGRIFHLYGPFEPSGRFVPHVIRSLLAEQKARCTAGTQVRDFMHVSDVARAFSAVLDSDIEGPVNVGSGCGITLREIAEEVAAQIGRRDLLELGFLPTGIGEPERLVADVTRLRTLARFQPRVSLRDGIADSISWWRGKP